MPYSSLRLGRVPEFFHGKAKEQSIRTRTPGSFQPTSPSVAGCSTDLRVDFAGERSASQRWGPVSQSCRPWHGLRRGITWIPGLYIAHAARLDCSMAEGHWWAVAWHDQVSQAWLCFRPVHSFRPRYNILHLHGVQHILLKISKSAHAFLRYS